MSLLAASAALAVFALASPVRALSGADGTPGDPGLIVDHSTTLNSGDTYQGTNGGVGDAGGSFPVAFGGNGGSGGDGASVDSTTPLTPVTIDSGTFVGGHGGDGGAGLGGGTGGKGGDGVGFGNNVLANINGGSFTGGSGGSGGFGIGGGQGGNGGAAVYNLASDITIRGGSFTGGSAGTGGVSSGTDPGTGDPLIAADGANGPDFWIDGGSMNFIGKFTDFTKPVVGGYGSFTGTFANNVGLNDLENVTYSYFYAGGQVLVNGVPQAVPEASSAVTFAVLSVLGCLALARRRKSVGQPA